MSRWRGTLSGLVTALAVALLWLILVLPTDLRDVDARLWVLVPVEGLVLLALMIWAPPRLTSRVVRWGGWVLALMLVLRLLDLGFDAVFDRPLDLVNDWVYLRAGVEVVAYEYGAAVAAFAVFGLLLSVGALVATVPRMLGRVAVVVAGHREPATTLLIALILVWAAAVGLGWRTSPRTPVAAHSVVDGVVDKVVQSAAALSDRRTFQREIATDAFDDAPPAELLSGLSGKDVLVVFVESYGRVAVEDPIISLGVDAVLDKGTRTLSAQGFGACSGFLTSPTYGAGSWLGHSTLQAGLWVDSQYRYNRLLLEDRTTLTSAFGGAGWRTVTYAPAITKPWPEGERFYGFDELVRGGDIAYDGPRFGFESVPDQFTLARLQESELAGAVPTRDPVMAEVNLISSHHPWTPIPRLVDWSMATDPAAYAGQLAGQPNQRELFADPAEVRAAYGEAIQYSLSSVISFVETYGTDDLVVLMVGDHQPHSYVSGIGADHDVPVTVIAGDPGVWAAVEGWGWEPGLNPSPAAPVARMDGFRDRFLKAFSQPIQGSAVARCG